MRTVAITGAEGFLGWHLSCRLVATRGVSPVRLGRRDFDDPERLATALSDVDTVIHVAGVNRADTDDLVEQGNVELAETLARGLSGRQVHIVYADSVQADLDNAYGRGKRRAAEILASQGSTVADVLLPNLFGEHGRPGYNSFVATFCHAVADGGRPQVTGDRAVPLLHAQDAAEQLLRAAEERADRQARPAGQEHLISAVLERLEQFHALYAERGELPDLADPFDRDLFNTYRAALFPRPFPVTPQTHVDARGLLVESVRSHGGTGQSFVSTTVPGAVRGDHYHLTKVERFMVVRGEAEIALRRLFHDEVVTFRISGERPGFVDMPTMWTHHVRNVGSDDLVMSFWADQLLDPEHPDQYPLKVEMS